MQKILASRGRPQVLMVTFLTFADRRRNATVVILCLSVRHSRSSGHWGSANGLSTACSHVLVCRRCVGVFLCEQTSLCVRDCADHRHISRVRSCWLVRRCQHFSRRPLKSPAMAKELVQAGYPVVDGDKLTTGHLTSAGLRTPLDCQVPFSNRSRSTSITPGKALTRSSTNGSTHRRPPPSRQPSPRVCCVPGEVCDVDPGLAEQRASRPMKPGLSSLRIKSMCGVSSASSVTSSIPTRRGLPPNRVPAIRNSPESASTSRRISVW